MRPPPPNSQPAALRRSRICSCPASGLIDLVIAITVFSFIATGTLSLIRVSVRGEQSLEAQSAANDRALDAFAALKNIRGTNYLRFASDPDNCWNKLEVADVSDCSDGSADAITEGVTYYLAQDFDSSPLGEWHLYELVADEDAYIDRYIMGGQDWYLQSGVANGNFEIDESHVFERTLTVEYGDLDGDGTDDYYDATVVITWTDSSSTEPHVLTKTGRIPHIY